MYSRRLGSLILSGSHELLTAYRVNDVLDIVRKGNCKDSSSAGRVVSDSDLKLFKLLC